MEISYRFIDLILVHFLSLTKMGALRWDDVVNHHQAWRLVTCIWLHAGVVHLAANMLSLVFIGIRLEQQFGFGMFLFSAYFRLYTKLGNKKIQVLVLYLWTWSPHLEVFMFFCVLQILLLNGYDLTFLKTLAVRIGIIYLLSGFGGSVLSSLFIRNNISVGASGALFGLLGAMLSELITNWSIYTNKVSIKSLVPILFLFSVCLLVLLKRKMINVMKRLTNS